MNLSDDPSRAWHVMSRMTAICDDSVTQIDARYRVQREFPDLLWLLERMKPYMQMVDPAERKA